MDAVVITAAPEPEQSDMNFILLHDRIILDLDWLAIVARMPWPCEAPGDEQEATWVSAPEDTDPDKIEAAFRAAGYTGSYLEVQ